MPTLNWIGKERVTQHHLDVPFRTLEARYSFGAPGPAPDNLVIHGDNLEALKALLPLYEGQVKVVCIDPPYNTGNEGWVYNDNVNDPKIKKWLGEVVGREGEDLSRHDKWLCMMYPRLKLLQRLLSNDGSIWVCIDDNEVASLRMMMDEIFGRQNFVASNVWQKRYSRENREAIGDVHDYVLVYAKDPESFKASRNKIPPDESQAKIYRNPDNPKETDPSKRWRGLPLSAQGFRPNQMYEITAPNGKKHLPPEGRCWSTVESEFQKLVAAGRVYWGKDGNAQPSIIRFLSEVEGFVPWTWWPHEEVGHTDEARKEIQSIFGTQTAFDTPKPTRLIERILQIATSKDSDLVLDSFAGSGTTGHAVLKLNASDGGTRRFILIEREDYAETVTAERLRKVIGGYGPADKPVPGLGGGFSFVALGATIFNADGQLNPAVEPQTLRQYIWYAETRTPLPFQGTDNQDYLGSCRSVSYYFYYRPDQETTLDLEYLRSITIPDDQYVVYADRCAVEPAFLAQNRIQFKKIPRDIPRY